MLSEAIRRFGGHPDALASVRRDPAEVLGYVEVHIEQGPILQQQGAPVGIVSAISGQSRVELRFTGQAGHAGTTPMALRRDALVAAARFIAGVEFVTRDDPELVATVGQCDVEPNVSNVIPGQVTLTLDVRHPLDAHRAQACQGLEAVARQISDKARVIVHWRVVQQTAAVSCCQRLSALLAEAVCHQGSKPVYLASGAGHDAAVMASLAPVAMLFVRCKDGLSHHPEEHVEAEDVCQAIMVLSEFLRRFANGVREAGAPS
jgi:allantoate deiminase